MADHNIVEGEGFVDVPDVPVPDVEVPPPGHRVRVRARVLDEDEDEEERPVQRRRLFVGADTDPYPGSDDESFFKLEDYFELLDVDRKRPEGMELPPPGTLTADWCLEALNREVERLCLSECFKRRTLGKVLERFVHKNHVDLPTYRLMCEIARPEAALGGARPWRTEGNMVRAWMHYLRTEHNTSFLKLSLLYSFHRDLFLEQFAVPGALSVFTLDPVHVCLQHLRTALWEHARAYFTYLCASEGMQPRANAMDDEHSDDEAPVTYSRYQRMSMSAELQRYAKPLYRLRLIGLLGEEARSVRTGSLCLRRLLPGSLADLAVSYLEPNYWSYPVRGPFRAGFQGYSELPGMYGPVPNPRFWYCTCNVPASTTATVVCGHAPLSVRVRMRA